MCVASWTMEKLQQQGLFCSCPVASVRFSVGRKAGRQKGPLGHPPLGMKEQRTQLSYTITCAGIFNRGDRCAAQRPKSGKGDEISQDSCIIVNISIPLFLQGAKTGIHASPYFILTTTL